MERGGEGKGEGIERLREKRWRFDKDGMTRAEGREGKGK